MEQSQSNDPPAKPSPLPDPGGEMPLPDQYRYPFTGITAPPTAVPSATERRRNLDRVQRSRRRRGFVVGLLAGQLLILALDLGGGLALRLMPDRIRLHAPVPLESLVFIGMTAGIVLTALFIFFILGVGALADARKKGFFSAVGHGMRRTFKAAWALGLTIGVIGGTAWFMIPTGEWKPTTEFLRGHGEDALEKAKGWASDLLPKK